MCHPLFSGISHGGGRLLFTFDGKRRAAHLAGCWRASSSGLCHSQDIGLIFTTTLFPNGQNSPSAKAGVKRVFFMNYCTPETEIGAKRDLVSLERKAHANHERM
jgi:hypothetical protein